MSNQTLEEKILDYLNEAGAPRGLQDIAKAVKIKPGQVKASLDALCDAHQLLKTRKSRYAPPQALGLMPGKVQVHAKGFAFFIGDAGGDDLFIAPDNLNGALNQDRVWVRPLPKPDSGRKGVGEVAAVISRAHTQVVGTFQKRKSGGVVIPQDTRMGEVTVPHGQMGGARSGDMVLADITQYAQGNNVMEGAVAEILGGAGDPGLNYTALVRQAGFTEDFPAPALRQAQRTEQTVSPAEIAGREDWRNVVTVTIDGADAKDLDDAISIRELKNGCYELGVHIADVSHYVKPHSALDEQAYMRATSVYFADRVWPMLPHALSNGICSLNPDVDRLALSCIMEVDKKGAVQQYRVAETVIHSDARMTYHDVSRILEGDAGLCEQYRALIPEFMRMQTLTHILIQMRRSRGALDFDVPEAKAEMGADGKAESIYRVQRGFAERIIESFMLLANETVAEYTQHLGVPSMYRVHEPPQAEALQTLAQAADMLGYSFRIAKGRSANHALRRLLQEAEGTPEQPLLNMLCLRTMQKARYGAENLQHFGLAAPYYTHFTSPIRRYPDLTVHRMLKRVLGGDIPGQTGQALSNMEQMAKHCSERERAAEEAERAVMDLQCCEVMRHKIGKQYDGIISGVTNFGFFVMLPNTVEGLVHVMSLPDYYEYDEKRLCLRSPRSGHTYRLGDTVRVRVEAVDEQQRRIDFGLAKPK